MSVLTLNVMGVNVTTEYVVTKMSETEFKESKWNHAISVVPGDEPMSYDVNYKAVKTKEMNRAALVLLSKSISNKVGFMPLEFYFNILD